MVNSDICTDVKLDHFDLDEGGIIMAAKHVEYICSYCGTRVTRSVEFGRPNPGTCSRKGKTKDGKGKPHTWVVSRRF